MIKTPAPPLNKAHSIRFRIPIFSLALSVARGLFLLPVEPVF